jgi:methylenetetrahydrofolate dehydrogenase (NADP+)/methenyltetrahydrofolate cyclohydrolase
MRLLSGQRVANKILKQVKDDVLKYCQNDIQPTLAVVMATNDPQAERYVRSLMRSARACSIKVDLDRLDAGSSTKTIAKTLQSYAQNSSIHGLILQTPLPKRVDVDSLYNFIPYQKDIDGATVMSAGQLAFGLPTFVPATAQAVIALFEHYKINVEGKHVVIVGRSRIVGKPLAQLLLQKNATVTVCHSKTKKLSRITRNADILAVAVGKAGLITPKYVHRNQVIIDIGTNVNKLNKLEGDVAANVVDKVRAITPVPGGIGPITTALILQHVVTAVGAQILS